MTDPFQPNQNHRLSRRSQAKRRIKIVCQRGTMELGANLALSVLDLSESGLCLVLKEALAPGQEVSLTLEPAASVRPIKRLGTIVWSMPQGDGTHRVGVSLEKRLEYRDLLDIV